MREVYLMLPRPDGVLPLWPLCLEVLRALGAQYYPVMEETALQAGMDDCDWYLLLPALMFDPEETSTEKLRVRHPYYSAQSYEARLRKLAELGYLRQTDLLDTEQQVYAYALTEAGRMTIHWIIRAADQAMEKLHPLENGEALRLLELLRRLVRASLAAPKPPPWLVFGA